MDSSYGLYGGAVQAPSHLPPYLLGSATTRGSSVGSFGKHNSLVNTSSEQLLHRSFNARSGGSIAEDPSLTSAPRFEKFPLKGPPVRNLHDDNHAYTSTPVLPSSPERRQLSFSVTQSVKKSPYGLEALSAHDSIAPDYSYNTSMRSLSSGEAEHPYTDRLPSHSDEGGSDNEMEQYWVTVFGFPPSASSYILSQFSQCGTILKYKVMSSGNWMHILYQSRLDAKKALGKNGKVFGNGIMVGVQRCVDRAVLNSHSESLLDYTSSSEQHSAYIRPLTAAYQASSTKNQVLPVSTNTPQKKDSLLSKAVEYIFGW